MMVELVRIIIYFLGMIIWKMILMRMWGAMHMMMMLVHYVVVRHKILILTVFIGIPYSMICLIRVYFCASSYAQKFNPQKKSITYRLIIII